MPCKPRKFFFKSINVYIGNGMDIYFSIGLKRNLEFEFKSCWSTLLLLFRKVFTCYLSSNAVITLVLVNFNKEEENAFS